MYLQLKNIMTDEMCKKLIQIYQNKHRVGRINKQVFEFFTRWNKDVDMWIKDYLNAQVIPLAKEKWNFNKDHFTNIKVREYPTGTFYEPHVDFHHPQPSRIYLSFSIALNSEFEGGEFVLEGDKKFPIKKGNGLLFQGTDVHEVLPITSGQRISIIGHLIAEK
ncbi:MAG: 2OG-Fe(II) oxygenase [Alphaproteobacteria bacterium]|nr:MAG: 2OG-Fe(II) oxygenase [Alphaproteobacteria bacterium]